MTPTQRLAALQGAWCVRRAIRHDDGTRAGFSGEAVWDGARCTESGTLRMGAARMQARRVTLWTVQGDALTVAFEDGRPFHRVAAEAVHRCPPDLYRLRYDFAAWPIWSCRWRVDGPRKGYGAVTRYGRI